MDLHKLHSAALISPDGSTSPADSAYTEYNTQGFTPGDVNHPLQYDTYQQNWYLRVTAATSGDLPSMEQQVIKVYIII